MINDLNKPWVKSEFCRYHVEATILIRHYNSTGEVGIKIGWILCNFARKIR